MYLPMLWLWSGASGGLTKQQLFLDCSGYIGDIEVPEFSEANLEAGLEDICKLINTTK